MKEKFNRFDLSIITYDYGRGPGFDVETGVKVSKIRKLGIFANDCLELIASTLPLQYNDCTDEGIRNMQDLHWALMHYDEYNVKFGAEDMPHYEINIVRIV